MKRKSVHSTAVKSVGYDPQTSTLEVEFTSGDLFQFFMVPAAVFRDFLEAQSLGAFFQAAIKGRYPFARTRGSITR